MAEMLVDSTKLDACLDAEADAIRAKTGGSADIPFDFANNKGFADAIAAIPSDGGGEKTLTKLGEYSVSSAVSRIDITLTEQMLGCEALYIKLDSITLSAADWIYPTLNSYSLGSAGMGYTAKQSSFTGVIACAPIKNAFSVTNRAFLGSLMSVLTVRAISSPSTLNLRLYTSSVTFTSGTVEIWGYV